MENVTTSIKSWLVDIPVLVNIWIRPECQRKQFDIIKQVRPSILFLCSDGGRNDDEWNLIKQNRQLVDEGIDWNCSVYRLYEDTNNGLYTMFNKSSEFIWSKVDRCIMLEDDIIPSVSFFNYCAELLEKYKDDLRIQYISGLNYEGITHNVDVDYFFSGESSIWGYAVWKRTVENYTLEYQNCNYYLQCILELAKHDKPGYEKKIKGYAINPTFSGHIPGPEFYRNFSRFAQNQVCIVPKYNLVSNIGVVNGSAHAPNDIKKLSRAEQKNINMKTYELEFPLKHPSYVVRDLRYERICNARTAWGHPIAKIWRKCSRFTRCLIYGDFNYIWRMIYKLSISRKEK